MRAVDNGGRVRASVERRADSQAKCWPIDYVSTAGEEFKGLGGVRTVIRGAETSHDLARPGSSR